MYPMFYHFPHDGNGGRLSLETQLDSDRRQVEDEKDAGSGSDIAASSA